MNKTNASIGFLIAMALMVAVYVSPCWASPAATMQAQPAIARSIGTVKSINGNAITLVPSSGPQVEVSVQPGARILKLGADRDLKNATPIQLSDVQVGDTIRARGSGSPDGKSISALEILVISSSALAAVSDQIRQDWQKRGSGGVVSAVDPVSGTVTISITSLAGKKTIVIHASKETVIRRYAPDSVKFEDAKVSTLQEIHPGDQLRVRGNRNLDGTEITADEIVTGVFPNFAGTVISVDASSGIIAVQDLQTKKPVQVKVTGNSQLHKLPLEMAQGFAARIKGASGIAGIPGAGGGGAGSRAAAGASATTAAGSPGSGHGAAGASYGGAGRAGGATSGGMRGGDFQQLLTATPPVALADLKKGDAIVLLTTEGSASNPGTVITLVAGVEPILQAAPSAGQAMMLAPWSLGGAPGGGEGNP